MGRRVSNEFTVPVCRVHHRELHRSGDEAAWWRKLNIDPLPVALQLWQHTRADGELAPSTEDVTLDFSRPGKPTDNAFIESFNGKFRAECLNTHWFMSFDDARRKCEAWRRDYNEERPHSAIGNKAPIELIDRSVAHGPP
jgi:putative transposase